MTEYKATKTEYEAYMNGVRKNTKKGGGKQEQESVREKLKRRQENKMDGREPSGNNIRREIY